MSVTFNSFSPEPIKWQNQLFYDFFHEIDWRSSYQEILLSGSVGSAKTTAMAWLAIHECITQRNCTGLIGRLTMPDLKKTLFLEICEMLTSSTLKEGPDYMIKETTATIKFPKQNSFIIPGYWRDKRYKKFRSLALSWAMIEELTENGDQEKEAYDNIMMRIGRRKAKRHFLMSATNPDGPAHWVYKHFFEENKADRRVYYSVTSDNPFLDPLYIKGLKRDLDPKMARRMLYGEWVEIARDVIYHAYTKDLNFRDQEYEINPNLPIDLCFDFNIGEGKPMSTCVGQDDVAKDTIHFFDEAVIPGTDTEMMMHEWASRGLFENNNMIRIFGDATGASRTTKSKHSDYDIIKHFLDNYRRQDGSRVHYVMCVPKSNPPIRTRHNRVNAYCKNELGNSRLFIYRKCKVAEKGMRLTALKQGGNYIEDDSKEYQHITTAMGYYVVYVSNSRGLKKISIQG